MRERFSLSSFCDLGRFWDSIRKKAAAKIFVDLCQADGGRDCSRCDVCARRSDSEVFRSQERLDFKTYPKIWRSSGTESAENSFTRRNIPIFRKKSFAQVFANAVKDRFFLAQWRSFEFASARKCLAAENDCADISAWTKILKGIKIYYGDNYGTTQENNAYKVDNLGRYCMFA